MTRHICADCRSYADPGKSCPECGGKDIRESGCLMDRLWHPAMTTAVRSITYNFETRGAIVRLPNGCCTDMSGCIASILMIDPAAREIKTFSGAAPDSSYIRHGEEWYALRRDGSPFSYRWFKGSEHWHFVKRLQQLLLSALRDTKSAKYKASKLPAMFPCQRCRAAGACSAAAGERAA